MTSCGRRLTSAWPRQTSIPTSGNRSSIRESEGHRSQTRDGGRRANTATASSTSTPSSSGAVLQTVPQVSKVDRARACCRSRSTSILAGAARRLRASSSRRSRRRSAARNITLPGGILEVARQDVGHRSVRRVQEREGDRRRHRRRVGQRSPVYLRDGVDIGRGYQSPPRSSTSSAGSGTRRAHGSAAARSRSAFQMRRGEQIGEFGDAVDARARRSSKPRLPDGPDPGAHLRPAAAGRGERRPVHDEPVRGDRARRARRADRLLGVALGAADGARRSRSRWR